MNNNYFIEDIFQENKFNKFVAYCKEHDIVSMSDLEGFDFEQLNNVKGIGKGKINDVISRYNEYFGDKAPGEFSTNIDSTVGVMAFEQINEELVDLDISFIMALGYKKKMVQLLQEAGYNKIGDLRNVLCTKFKRDFSNYNANKLLECREYFKKSLLENLEHILTVSVESRAVKVFLLRFIGYTLDAVGADEGVTKERIRQIEEKFYNKLSPIMNPIIARLIASKGYITIQDLLDLFTDDNNAMVIIYWCKLCDSLEYLQFADMFVPKQKESVEGSILALAEELIGDDLLDLRDSQEEIEMALQENGYSYIKVSDLVELLKLNGYKKYGDYIAKDNIKHRYGYFCSKLVEKYFPNGIKLSETYTNELTLLRQYADKEYGDIGIPEDTHTLVNNLKKFLVLSGRAEYRTESNVHIPINLLDEIKEYIDKSPEKKMDYSAVFKKFERKLLMMSNVDNHNFLHGVLRLYYPDDYIFSQRDYLEKRGDGYKTISRADKIIAVIKENGKPAYRREIMKKVHGLTDIVLLNTMNQSEDLFQWDYNMYYLISELEIDDADKDFLRSQIEDIMKSNRGYCNDNLLYEKIKKMNPDFLVGKNIGNSTNLFFTCSKILGDAFDFRRPHITRKGLLAEISTRSVAMYLLNNPTMLSYEVYNNLATDLKWATGSTYASFSDIEKDYIRTSLDQYVLKEKFILSDSDRNEIENVIQKQMISGYVSLINFDEWKDELPEIEYEWNVFLFRSIIDHYIESYKIIEPQSKDRRYEKGLLINRFSAISAYDEFVANYISEQGYTEISAGEMLNQLVVNNLTYNMIPKDLYLSEKIKYEEQDGKFYIV